MKYASRNWSSIISIVLSLVIISILLIANFTLQPKLDEIRSKTIPQELNIVQEPLTKEKDYLDFTCNDLITEFNSEQRTDLANIILDVMLLKECSIKAPCISDEKFNIIIEQFRRGIISQERFEELNEEYINCV